MTFDQARAQLIGLTGAESQDVDDYLSATPEDRDALLQIMKDSLAVTDLSAWQTFLADLKVASGIAQDLLPIAGLAAALVVL